MGGSAVLTFFSAREVDSFFTAFAGTLVEGAPVVDVVSGALNWTPTKFVKAMADVTAATPNDAWTWLNHSRIKQRKAVRNLRELMNANEHFAPRRTLMVVSALAKSF